MPRDLDTLTIPGSSHEIFEPSNAWADAASRVYLDINRIHGGVSQTGFDPETQHHWLRWKSWDGEWSQWLNLSVAPNAPAPKTQAQ